VPRDAPEPIAIPEQVWRLPAVLDLCRGQDANGLFKLAKQYGASNERIAYWTGTDAGEISKRLNGRITGPVKALDRWHRIADGLNMPDHARLELGIAPRNFRNAHVTIDPSPPTTSAQVVHPVDGKAMALVEAGVFLKGHDNEPAFLDAFYIDVTPVTNREYQRFVAATGHEPPPHWKDDPAWPHRERNHPVVNVSHEDAAAYAQWAGKRLPTEAEWEKAARGPKGNFYPWGNKPTEAKCNVRETGVGSTTPVGNYRSGISPYGVYDLCGNVWEWCSTQTRPQRYVLKGSAFTSPFAAALPAETNDADAHMRDDDTGFRCTCSVALINELFSG
jgi:hypothetical protein